MSSCEVYAVNKNGYFYYYDEAKNAWGGAIHIWDTLAKKHDLIINGFDYSPVWKLYNSEDICPFENLVLASTFDRVVCLKERLPELIAAFKMFYNSYPTTTIQHEIEILENVLNDEKVVGVAWNQTSVCSFNDVFIGEHDEESGEESPYNIFKQDDHWFL